MTILSNLTNVQFGATRNARITLKESSYAQNAATERQIHLISKPKTNGNMMLDE